MLTKVCQPLVLLSLTHTETVKLCAVLSTALNTGTMPADVPLSAIAGAPAGPVVQLAPVPRKPVFPFPEESAVLVPLPSLIAQWPAGAGRVTAACVIATAAKTPVSSAVHATAIVARRSRRVRRARRRDLPVIAPPRRGGSRPRAGCAGGGAPPPSETGQRAPSAGHRPPSAWRLPPPRRLTSFAGRPAVAVATAAVCGVRVMNLPCPTGKAPP